MKLKPMYQFRFAWALALSVFVGNSLLAATMLINRNVEFWFMPYNLALGFVPLVLAWWLARLLKHRAWLSWLPMLATLLWLLFLPNSFYIITDFIHLGDASRVDRLLDIIMLTSFSVTGLIFGCLSLYVVHCQYLRRVGSRLAWPLVALVIAACSFAIYVGRYLRWNSWDVFVQPVTMFTDISQQFSLPYGYVPLFTTVLGFFVLIASAYSLSWELARRVETADKTR